MTIVFRCESDRKFGLLLPEKRVNETGWWWRCRGRWTSQISSKFAKITKFSSTMSPQISDLRDFDSRDDYSSSTEAVRYLTAKCGRLCSVRGIRMGGGGREWLEKGRTRRTCTFSRQCTRTSWFVTPDFYDQMIRNPFLRVPVPGTKPCTSPSCRGPRQPPPRSFNKPKLFDGRKYATSPARSFEIKYVLPTRQRQRKKFIEHDISSKRKTGKKSYIPEPITNFSAKGLEFIFHIFRRNSRKNICRSNWRG